MCLLILFILDVLKIVYNMASSDINITLKVTGRQKGGKDELLFCYACSLCLYLKLEYKK